jgi:TetR/AcrR family transcriptional repressor for divergent bdcA
MGLFHRKGYDAVGVAEIGNALGIRPPSFYAAFGSKAGLFRRTLETYAAGEANVFANALADGGDVVTVIDCMFRNAARVYASCDGATGCLVIDGARNSADPEARAIAREMQTASRAVIRDFIATEYPARADDLASFCTIALAGMSAAARDGDDGAALSGFAEKVSRSFRREAAQSG